MATTLILSQPVKIQFNFPTSIPVSLPLNEVEIEFHYNSIAANKKIVVTAITGSQSTKKTVKLNSSSCHVWQGVVIY